MLETLIVAGAISLFIAILGAVIALKRQQRALAEIQLEHQAWERAQESGREAWQLDQAKRANELENKLHAQVQQVQTEWQAWQSQDIVRMEQIAQHYEEIVARTNLEKDLARLPHVEEIPLPPRDNRRHQDIAGWQPPSFYRTNLSGRDFSYRYLGNADLREAKLVHTNFYMADLSGACLAGADLSGANLCGANLKDADLRNVTLTGANLLVADLHHAVLVSTNLLGVRNLTTQQVYSAIYDSTTLLDAEIETTLPPAHQTPIRQESAEPAGNLALKEESSTQPETAEAAIEQTPETVEVTAEPLIETETPPEASDAPIERAIEAETPLESPAPTIVPDTSTNNSQPIEPAPLLPLTHESPLNSKARDFPGDTPKNRHTKELHTATRNTRHNGKRRAKAR